MESATERLAEKLAELPEEERESLAEATLEELDYRAWVRRKLQVAIEQADRGEVRPLESHEAFMARMKAKHNF